MTAPTRDDGPTLTVGQIERLAAEVFRMGVQPIRGADGREYYRLFEPTSEYIPLKTWRERLYGRNDVRVFIGREHLLVAVDPERRL
jgi:hypothetical protein